VEKKKKRPAFREIGLDLIDRPDQIVRMEISEGEIEELKESILEVGLLQPILVHPKGERFGIIAGDRRYLAHERAGLKTIMCSVKDIPLDAVIWLRAVENIQRKDLTPVEEGYIYAGLHKDRGISIEEIAKKMSKSAGVIKRRMDILRMPDSFQKALHAGSVSIAVAEELWSCPDGGKREYFLELAIEHGITMRVARMWVEEFRKSMRGAAQGVEGAVPGSSPYEDMPIYRACDVCRGPVEYKDLVEFRVCRECGIGIRSVMEKES